MSFSANSIIGHLLLWLIRKCIVDKHLYVIGNGFDIHHNIPSKYYDTRGGDCFRKWLDENDGDTLCEINDIFGFTTDEWWKNFEENLASVETLRIAYEDAFEHYPDFGSDDFRDRDYDEASIAVKIRLDNVFDNISNAFMRWIGTLPNGNDEKKVRLKTENGVFITFNYTHTLENLYKISADKILHIHGDSDTNTLVFGHGLHYSELRKEMEKYERVEYGDYICQTSKEAAIYSVASHRKRVEKIIEENKQWFSQLHDITHIHILGHSLAKVDLPYFHKIMKSCDMSSVFVEISCFDDAARENAMGFLKSLKIDTCNYRLIDLRGLQVYKDYY